MSAAFYAALVSGVLRGIRKAEQAPDHILWFLNDRLSLRDTPGMFCTLCYGVLDRTTGELSVANGGLPAALCRSTGAVEPVPSSGVPLGLFETSQYETWSTELRAGDAFVVHTDGLSEVWNKKGELFGMEGVYAALKKTSRRNAQQISDQILQAMMSFSGSTLAHDDIALLVLKLS
jgi:sigma-B regulation protein RsbU (phosphoserine phosphatase)